MKYILLFSMLFFGAGCMYQNFNVEKVNLPSIKDVPAEKWDKLARKKIYFGHKSVGYGVVDGIKDVMKENEYINLNIVETSNSDDSDLPIFAHSAVGENFDHRSKIVAFEQVVEKGIGSNFDIVFFKFCWADIPLNADIEKIFKDYKNSMSRIKNEYPETTYIHVTVPLTTDFSGGKALVKKAKDMIKIIIGKNNFYDNAARNEFNEMLRGEYAGKEPVFDLAKFESTFIDGKQRSFVKDGITHYTLLPENTDDGGHLNETGRKLVAEQLLIQLALLAQ